MTNQPVIRLLDAALLAAPALYLLTDVLYAAAGWDDGNVAGLNMLAAIVYALAVARLVLFADGKLQAAMAVCAAVGLLANFGTAVNTLHVHYGHEDLFDLDGPANAFKMLGFFFPLTLLLGAIAVRKVAPFWATIALAVGAALFPPAHVANNDVLAIVDGLILLVAFVGIWQTTRATTGATSAAGLGTRLPAIDAS